MAKEGVDFGTLDGSEVRVGVIKTRWNKEIIDDLADGVKSALEECNVKKENTFVTEVPGAYELPLAARLLALSQTVDAIVCLGCLIKGETMHFEYIADAVSKGIMDVNLSSSVPVVFGVLTTLDEEQAVKRSKGDNNHGISWGKTAVEMGLLRLSSLGKTSKGGGLGFDKVTKVGEGKGSGEKGPKIGF
ncbi:unnamed protein product [Chrysoparadoxa australica]